jgi:hypothetical protein
MASESDAESAAGDASPGVAASLAVELLHAQATVPPTRMAVMLAADAHMRPERR